VSRKGWALLRNKLPRERCGKNGRIGEKKGEESRIFGTKKKKKKKAVCGKALKIKKWAAPGHNRWEIKQKTASGENRPERGTKRKES